MKRIAKIAVVIVLALITFLNVCTMLINALNLRDRLNLFPAALLEVESGSMEPRLSVGDLLVIWETPYEKLKAGDIITFHHGTELVTHELCRWEGSRLVTKGLANTKEDASIGPEEYCAKLLFAIPMGGVILDALTAPISLVCCVLLLLFVFYGKTLLIKLMAKWEKKSVDVKRPGILRIAASVAAVSVLTVTPFMTSAKYTAQINEYTTAVAAAKYLSSNYISEEGTTYDIHGWNGENYEIILQIHNYDNDLLFNTLGHDVKYCIRLVPITGAGYKDDYELTLADNVPDEEALADFDISENWPAGTDYGPFVLTGNDESGITGNYRVSIAVHQDDEHNYVLNPGDRIRFQIYAGTETDDEYFQELWGDFTLEVATANRFLGEQHGETAVGTSLVTYTLKTNQVGGNSTRNIKISWDRSKLYVNEYEATIQNLKVSHPENLVLNDGTGRGYAILPLQAYSSVSMQFFKFDANTDIHFSGYNDSDGVGHVADVYVLEVDVDPEPVPPEDIEIEEPEGSGSGADAGSGNE